AARRRTADIRRRAYESSEEQPSVRGETGAAALAAYRILARHRDGPRAGAARRARCSLGAEQDRLIGRRLAAGRGLARHAHAEDWTRDVWWTVRCKCHATRIIRGHRARADRVGRGQEPDLIDTSRPRRRQTRAAEDHSS